MMRRCGLLLMLGLLVAGPGCATTPGRAGGSPILGSRAWSEAPAPPQRAAALESPTPAVAGDPASRSDGLAKYFPGLHRSPVEAPKLAARYRPSWFGLRPKAAQVYTTDARAGLNRPGAEPSTLPVALQVPTERGSSDRAVTTTGTEGVRPASTSKAAGPAASESREERASSAIILPDLGGRPSRPGEDEVNPLPPAAEPGNPVVLANRMPEVPAIDPIAASETAAQGPAAPGQEPGAEPAEVPSSGEKSVQTIPATGDDANRPSGLPAATVPTSYSSQAAPKSEDAATPSESPATATATTKEPAKPQPAPAVRPSPQVDPTSLVKPSPQSPCTHTCETHKRKKSCVCRLVRKICHLPDHDAAPPAKSH